MMVDPGLRPTKVDRPSDVTGLVDTGDLVGILGPADATAVMESIYRISGRKMTNADFGQTITADAVVKEMIPVRGEDSSRSAAPHPRALHLRPDPSRRAYQPPPRASP